MSESPTKVTRRTRCCRSAAATEDGGVCLRAHAARARGQVHSLPFHLACASEVSLSQGTMLDVVQFRDWLHAAAAKKGMVTQRQRPE